MYLLHLCMYMHLLQCNTFDTFDMPTIEYVTFHTVYTVNTCTYHGRMDCQMACLSWIKGAEGLCKMSLQQSLLWTPPFVVWAGAL